MRQRASFVTKELCANVLQAKAAANGGWITRHLYEKRRLPGEPSVGCLAATLGLASVAWQDICAAVGVAYSHHLTVVLDQDGDITDADAITALSQPPKLLAEYPTDMRWALATWSIHKVHQALGRPETLKRTEYDRYVRKQADALYMSSKAIDDLLGWHRAVNRAGVKPWEKTTDDMDAPITPTEAEAVRKRQAQEQAEAGFRIEQGRRYTERRQYNWATRSYETVRVYTGWFAT